MLLKLYTCSVPPDAQTQFDSGQEAWGRLNELDGFLGQTGGWCSTCPEDRPVIVGLWRDRESYDVFRNEVHDEIFEANGQKMAIVDGDSTIWSQLLDLDAEMRGVESSLLHAGLIRVDLFNVIPGLEPKFRDFIEHAWFGRIRAADGGLSAFFGCRCCHEPQRREAPFVICSVWKSAEDHDRYMYGGPMWWEYWDEHLKSVHEEWSYYVVPIEDAWRVKANGSG